MTTPDGDHLDLDEIAELDEGLPDDAEVRQRRTDHIAGCSACAARQAQLRTTRALLSTLPAEPMPADVAGRIDAALSAAGGTIVPATLQRRRLWARHPSLAGFAAAAAVAGLVAAVAIGAIHGSSSDGSPAASDVSGGAVPHATPQRTAAVLTTGRVYTPDNAGDLVNRLDAAATHSAAATNGAVVRTPQPSPAAVPLSLRAMFTDPAALANCVAQLTGVIGVTPVAVDYAHYSDPRHDPPLRHVPALVVLLPRAGAGGKDAAYIVGPHCATAPDNNIYRYQAVTG